MDIRTPHKRCKEKYKHKRIEQRELKYREIRWQKKIEPITTPDEVVIDSNLADAN